MLTLYPSGALYGTTKVDGSFHDSGTTASLFDSSWHFVVFTDDQSLGSNRQKVYLDGMSVVNNTSVAGSLDAPASTISIADQSDALYLNGTVGSLFVFGSAWTPEQVSSAWAAGRMATVLPTYSALVSWWRFDEGSGSCVYGYDATANLAPSQSLTLSQAASAVNSSVIITGTIPYQNATDLYNGTYYSQRANSTTLNFAFNHYAWLGISANPGAGGTVNLASG